MPTTMDHEEYLNTGEAAAFLGVSRVTFAKKFKPRLQGYEDPTDAKASLYKTADLEPFRVIKPKAKEESK